MPTAPRRACLTAGCLGYAEAFGRCLEHAAPIIERRQAARRDEAGRQWYGLARWRRLRLAVLAASPLCVACALVGKVTAAAEVDHVRAHHGDERLFWARWNLQALCALCHTAKTIAERRVETKAKGAGGG